MSDTNTQAETTTERKPPTIADIVREKTGDGRLIIDFFTDVMTGRIKGAELCHRIDAAKQLVKYGSKDAAEFLAKYKGVPCGHSINGRPDPADPCTTEERSLVAVTLNAPPTLTRDFLTVLSGIDEFLMARLIRAQTADGVTVIEFLDDVMQDRTDGFKTHHRIAAAKELIVHIIRDEQGSHTPSPSTGEGWGEGDSPVVGADPRVRPLPGSQTPSPSTGEGGACPESPRRSEGDSYVVPAQAEGNPDNTIVVPAKSLPRTRYGAGTQGRGVARPSEVGAHAELNSPVVPAKAGTQGGGVARPSKAGIHRELNSPVVPAKAGTQERGVARPSKAGIHRELNSPVVPAKAGTQGGGGARNTPANPAHPEPNSSVVPAKAGTHPRTVAMGEPATEQPGADTQPPNPDPAKGPQDDKARPPRGRRTRTQRRRDGNARAAALRMGSERNNEEKNEKPAPVELTIAERRIKEKLKQHWHEPDPWAAPIESTTPGRSPP